MKKVFSILMIFTLLFSLAACTGNTENEESSSLTQQSSTPSSTPTEEPNHQNDSSEPADETTEAGSKSLVVYFSWSGNTENVAKSIQSHVGADIFEIVPITPYSDDYDTVVDLAQEEQREDARPVISGSVENIAQYDVIYVGFPKMEQGYICV